MGKVAVGVGAPNRQWDDWTDAEYDLLSTLGGEAYVLLDYPEAHTAWIRQRQYGWLRGRFPGAPILVRMFDTNGVDRDPVELASNHAARAARYWEGPIEVEPLCEPNIEKDGASGDYPWEDWEALCDWLRRYAEAYRAIRPQDRLHMPPLSPRGRSRDFWGVAAAHGLGALYPVVDLHLYGPDCWGDLAAVAEAFGRERPIWVTETNTAPLADTVTECRKYNVEAVCWFILASPDSNFDWCSLAKHEDRRKQYRAVLGSDRSHTPPPPVAPQEPPRVGNGGNNDPTTTHADAPAAQPAPRGLGLWVWYWQPEFIALATRIGASYLLVKAADGTATVTGSGANRHDWSAQWREAKAACEAAGLGCIPWMYNYGDPAEVEVIAATGERHIVLDPEIEYERLPRAQQLAFIDRVAALRAQGVTVGCACWARPEAHGAYPFAELGMAIDYWLPMTAWMVWLPRDAEHWMRHWDGFGLGQTIHWLPAYQVSPAELAESVRTALARYGGATVWAAHSITKEMAAALEALHIEPEPPTEQQPPQEVPIEQTHEIIAGPDGTPHEVSYAFLATLRRFPALGRPTGDIAYSGGGACLQSFEKGLLVWDGDETHVLALTG